MIPFNNFTRHVELLKVELMSSFDAFLERGYYILGEELRSFEKEFSNYIGSAFGIGVASGTEALWLALKCLDIGPGDEVVTVPNTAIPTVAAILQSGAMPRFVDIEKNTGLLDCGKIESVITQRTKAIIPVHLFGQSVDMDPLISIAEKYGICLIEDCAQCHGALYKGKKAGKFGAIGCFSFYPTKNLGAFGDGGLLVTDNEDFNDKLAMLRNYGQKNRYETEIIGYNSRLDEMQAVFLRIKLRGLDTANARRSAIARKYIEGLIDLPIALPLEMAGRFHVYHLFVIQCEHRDSVQNYCREHGLQTLIHYPIPLHLQKAYAFFGYRHGDFPVCETFASQILSLPIYPELTEMEISEVISIVRDAVLSTRGE